MFKSCTDSCSLFCSSLDNEALLDGICDIVTVKQKNGDYKSSGFYVCFGPHAVLNRKACVRIHVNDK